MPIVDSIRNGNPPGYDELPRVYMAPASGKWDGSDRGLPPPYDVERSNQQGDLEPGGATSSQGYVTIAPSDEVDNPRQQKILSSHCNAILLLSPIIAVWFAVLIICSTHSKPPVWLTISFIVFFFLWYTVVSVLRPQRASHQKGRAFACLLGTAGGLLFILWWTYHLRNEEMNSE